MFGQIGPIFPELQVSTTKNAMLDSAAGQMVETLGDAGLNLTALNSEIQSVRIAALAVVGSITDAIIEKDLGEGELPSDRLDALLAGLSSDQDGEEIEVDQASMDILIANVQDAFASLGVADSVIATIFSDDQNADEAIELAAETVESNMPTGDDKQEFIDLFVYGEPQEEDGENSMLDGVSLGKTTTKSGKFGKVVYKAVKAIRNGHVAIVNKRVSGKVHQSAKQRMALAKARRKSNTSASIKKRVRSLKKAKQMNF